MYDPGPIITSDFLPKCSLPLSLPTYLPGSAGCQIISPLLNRSLLQIFLLQPRPKLLFVLTILPKGPTPSMSSPSTHFQQGPTERSFLIGRPPSEISTSTHNKKTALGSLSAHFRDL